MRSRFFRVLVLRLTLLLAVIVAAPAVLASEGVSRWLDRMSHSHRELTFSGLISYQSLDRMGSYRVSHGVKDGQEFEKVVALNGNGPDLVRMGHPVSCIHGGHQLLRFSNEEEKVALLGTLERFYELALEGDTRIAGRSAQSLVIQPRDVYRYGYRLALDNETGLMLSSELIDQKGRSIERFQFVQLDLQPPPVTASPGSRVQPVHSAHGELIDPRASRRVAAASAWRAEWLPSGFMLAETDNDPEQGEAQTYTDGLSVLSVFLERADKDSKPMLMREGATVAYTRTLQKNGAFWDVTVVGEVPDMTVRQVGASVRWQ